MADRSSPSERTSGITSLSWDECMSGTMSLSWAREIFESRRSFVSYSLACCYFLSSSLAYSFILSYMASSFISCSFLSIFLYCSFLSRSFLSWITTYSFNSSSLAYSAAYTLMTSFSFLSSSAALNWDSEFSEMIYLISSLWCYSIVCSSCSCIISFIGFSWMISLISLEGLLCKVNSSNGLGWWS